MCTDYLEDAKAWGNQIIIYNHPKTISSTVWWVQNNKHALTMCSLQSKLTPFSPQRHKPKHTTNQWMHKNNVLVLKNSRSHGWQGCKESWENIQQIPNI